MLKLGNIVIYSKRISLMQQNLTKKSEFYEKNDIFEGMVSIRSVFDGIDNGVCDRKIKCILFANENVRGNGKLLGFLKARSFVYGYELKTVPMAEINDLALGSTHGGIIMIADKRKYNKSIENKEKNGFYVLLEGIEDPFNLGYAIRSVYAAGADGVILPSRNAMVSAGTVCKSSAGASEMMQVYCGNEESLITSLKSEGYRLVCADMSAPAPAHLSDLKKPIILAIGGEKRGFSKAITELADLFVRLDYGRDFPMALSAASAAAILSFEVTKQN